MNIDVITVCKEDNGNADDDDDADDELNEIELVLVTVEFCNLCNLNASWIMLSSQAAKASSISFAILQCQGTEKIYPNREKHHIYYSSSMQ